jgi:hypothetical protein
MLKDSGKRQRTEIVATRIQVLGVRPVPNRSKAAPLKRRRGGRRVADASRAPSSPNRAAFPPRRGLLKLRV